MRYFFLPTLVLFVLACSSKDANVEIENSQDLPIQNVDSLFNVIAFGSCNHEEDNQSYWNVVSSFSPDSWIWMGDNIYGDTEDMQVLASKYRMLKENSYYASFIDKVKVYGTWDDHDYGVNDGNKSYPKKEESKALLLDFLDVPKGSKVYSRAGVYQSYIIGDAGRKVKLILLDTRSFQDPLEKNITRNPRYHKSDGDILGDDQWQWLERQLMDTTALTIIVSSIQFIPDDQIYEKWGNFPKSKERMLSLLKSKGHNKYLFLSGDRHISEISKMTLDGQELFEATSSGLTHSWEDCKEQNSYRVSPLVTQTSFGLMLFDWKENVFDLKLQIVSTKGEVLYTHSLGEFEI